MVTEKRKAFTGTEGVVFIKIKRTRVPGGAREGGLRVGLLFLSVQCKHEISKGKGGGEGLARGFNYDRQTIQHTTQNTLL